jgi:AAA domain
MPPTSGEKGAAVTTASAILNCPAAKSDEEAGGNSLMQANGPSRGDDDLGDIPECLDRRRRPFTGVTDITKAGNKRAPVVAELDAGREGGARRTSDKANGAAAKPTLTLSEWLSRDLPEPDFLLGELLSTTSRLLIVGPTGLGKTMFGLAVAFAIAGNKGFLHWAARRSGHVLYVDGEMSVRLMKRRLLDTVDRAGIKPEGLYILSREDFPDMPPLNSKEGQNWFDDKIAQVGPFDLVIFDNIQALLVGDMKDEEQWAKILDWVRDLTRRSIGQVWFHHTGHDETRSYGSKAREWQFDSVALMERVDTEDDLAFTLKFTKVRGRTPENRADFQSVTIQLVGDQWTLGKPTPKARMRSPAQRRALDALVSITAERGTELPASFALPQSLRGVTVEAWKAELFTKGIIDNRGSNPRRAFADLRNGLKHKGLIAEREGLIWQIS